MKIKAQSFQPLKGTVYVVEMAFPSGSVAQGVFKTLQAANKLKATIEANAEMAYVRVGHFTDSGDIETI